MPKESKMVAFEVDFVSLNSLWCVLPDAVIEAKANQ